MTTQLTLELRDESYHSIDDLGARQKQVYEVIKFYTDAGQAVTNKLIGICLSWPINCVTGRVNELMKLGLIEPAGKVYDATTNRNVTVFKITNHV